MALEISKAVAGMLACAIVASCSENEPEVYTITTQPGEIQVISLDRDLAMALNGASEAKVDEGSKTVALARGEAAFTSKADTASPWRVEFDDLALTDIGGLSRVTLGNKSAAIAVAESVVVVQPDAEDTRLAAGEAIKIRLDEGTVTRHEISPETIGTWRMGRLEFDSTPIDEAMNRIERSTGLSVAVDPRFGEALLSGVILIPEEPDDEEDFVNAMAKVIGGEANFENESWSIR
ncbi:MAG: FecR domain-containing protein [Pseudomonadota bacterium]